MCSKCPDMLLQDVGSHLLVAGHFLVWIIIELNCFFAKIVEISSSVGPCYVASFAEPLQIVHGALSLNRAPVVEINIVKSQTYPKRR